MRALLALLLAASFGLVQAEDRAKPSRAPKPSAGSSVTPATPEDSHADQLRREDERRATESKKRMKKKPGYKEDVPGPRA
jgi:hypothetical protein